MKHWEDQWKSKDGVELFAQAWEPDGEPKAVIALIHGIGEHTGRYAHLGLHFARHGYAVLGYDLRGHGKSGGRRGDFESIEVLMSDIDVLLEKAGENYSDKPICLYGHSLGGELVINYLLRRKPQGVDLVVATGPALRLAFEPSSLKVFLANLVKGIYPTFTQSTGLETAALSRDPQVERNYINDPLVHDLITARGFANSIELGDWALEHANQLVTPLLIMHGDADRLASVQASKEFAERAGYPCEIKIWNGFYHELHNEPEQGEVMDYVLNWIENNLS
jgi:alpha-beta hydrolase superfamily lysophospholipase